MVCFARFGPDGIFDPDWTSLSFELCMGVFSFLLSGWSVGGDRSYVGR